MRKSIRLSWVAVLVLAGVAHAQAPEGAPSAQDPFAGLAVVSGPAPADDASDQALRQAFDSLPGPAGASQIRVLPDNVQAWCARWWLMGQTQGTLDSTYFCLFNDAFGASFLGYLLRDAKKGRKVRLMIDATSDPAGTHSFKTVFMGQEYLQTLAGAGVPVRLYQPVIKKVVQQILSNPFKSTAVVACNHQKILVSDGQLSMTGGRNIAKEYFVDPGDDPTGWRDTDVLVRGADVAKGLTESFEAGFNDSGLTMKIPGWWSKLTDRTPDLLGAWIMMEAWLNGEPATEEEMTRLRTDESAREQAAQALLAQVQRRLPEEGVTRSLSSRASDALKKWALQLVACPTYRGALKRFSANENTRRADVKVIGQTSSLGDEPAAISEGLLKLLPAVRRRIVIENPYVVLTDKARAALEDLGKRGVHIVLITNSPSSSDSTLTQAFFLEDWPKLEARVPNLRIFVLTGKRKLHAKVGVLDDVLTVVGTYNLDLISARINAEDVTISWSRELAADTERSMDADMHSAANALKEYTIRRDGAGKPVLVNGEPVVTYGAQNHVDAKTWDEYKKRRERAKLIEELPQARSLR